MKVYIACYIDEGKYSAHTTRRAAREACGLGVDWLDEGPGPKHLSVSECGKYEVVGLPVFGRCV